MGKKLLITAIVCVCAWATHAQTVFINEFHYDDTRATDTLEGIEIAGPAGTDLDCYKIVLYNGSGGAPYGTVPLSGTIPDQCNNYGTVWFPISPLQNGSPDGFALVYDPALPGCTSGGALTVIQFLSYEGTFTAVGGDANGLLSTSVGVQETNATPVGNSLQLSGAGTDYTNFTWQTPAPRTPGALNNGQTFGVGPCAAIVPTELRFTAIPAGCLAVGASFSITVCATNSGGTVDPAFNGAITLSLQSGTPPLNGTTTVNAVAGCATFTGLSLTALDTFIFSATSGILNGTSSVIYTSASCATCPNLESAFIDACGGSEGNNEILIFTSGDYFIPVNSTNINLNYGASTPPATNYTGSFTSNSAYIDSLNAHAGCVPPLFMDALSNSPIPPNSHFMMMRFDPTNVYDFPTWCGQGPVYVLFTSDPDWNSTGNFKNCLDCAPPNTSGTTPRYFRANFGALGAGCDFTYEYTPCSDLTCLGDGDGLSWGYGGGTPTFAWNECTPTSLLPVTMSVPLQGTWASEGKAKLEWATAQESQSAYFAVERAVSGREGFREIGRVKAAGNSATDKHYQFTDQPPLGRDLLYRLRAVDIDGSASPSNVIRLASAPEAPLSVTVNHDAQVLHIPVVEGARSATIIDVQGRVMLERDIRNGESAISIEGLGAGVYFVSIRTQEGVRRAKFLFTPR